MMGKSFGEAIRKTGASAKLAGQEDAAFAASIRPASQTGDGRAAPGIGFLLRYTLYAEYNAASQSLTDGDKVEYADAVYRVEHIETHFMSGHPVYRKAILIMEEANAPSTVLKI